MINSQLDDKCQDMNLLNENFKNLNGDWTALSKTLASTQKILFEVRGFQAKVEIEVTATKVEINLKGYIIETDERNQVMQKKEYMVARASDADKARDELQKKYEAFVEQLAKQEAIIAKQNASLTEKDEANLEVENAFDGAQDEFVANLSDYNDRFVLGPLSFFWF